MGSRTILVVPVFNEASTIAQVLEQAEAFCDWVFVVDDGSRDDTRNLLISFGQTHPKLFFVSHRTNRGVSGALLTGFLILDEGFAAGTVGPEDVVVVMDGDGQHDAADIPRLIAPVRAKTADMVVGRRRFEKYPRIKRWGNWGLSRWASWWSGTSYEDAECGFRAFSMNVLHDMLPYFDPVQYGWAQEMAVIVGRRAWTVQNDVPIHVPRYRVGAKARDGFNNVACAARAWYRVRHAVTIEHHSVWRDVFVAGDMVRDDEHQHLRDNPKAF